MTLEKKGIDTYLKQFESTVDITFAKEQAILSEYELTEKSLEKTLLDEELKEGLILKKYAFTGYDSEEMYAVYPIRMASSTSDEKYIEDRIKFLIQDTKTKEILYITKPIIQSKTLKEHRVSVTYYDDDWTRERTPIHTLHWYAYPILTKILDESKEKLVFGAIYTGSLTLITIHLDKSSISEELCTKIPYHEKKELR